MTPATIMIWVCTFIRKDMRCFQKLWQNETQTGSLIVNVKREYRNFQSPNNQNSVKLPNHFYTSLILKLKFVRHKEIVVKGKNIVEV